MISDKNEVKELMEQPQFETPQSLPIALYPLTRNQQAAIQLYDIGFNVMPIPRVGMEHGGKKPPYGKFSFLFTTRLGRSSLPLLFDRSDIAVICGRLSNNLFILDCDKPQTFSWIGQELEKHNINAWVTESVRGGHYWLLSTEGEVRNATPIAGLDILGNHKYVVAPPSVHPSGLIYQWIKRDGILPPAVFLDKLPFLEGLSLIKARRALLPTVAKSVLIDKNLGNYQSNSEAELAAAMSLAKGGYSDEEIISIFEKYNPSHYASKKDSSSWFQRYILPKAFAYSNSAPNSNKLASWANSRPWPGRTGETDKSVFLALCHRAKLDGREHFRASVREVAELAHIEKMTAQRSLIRLIQDGLITKVGRDRLSNATLYQFPTGLGEP